MNGCRIIDFTLFALLILLPLACGCDKPERSPESYGKIVDTLPVLPNAKPAHEHMQGDHANCVFKDEDFF